MSAEIFWFLGAVLLLAVGGGLSTLAALLEQSGPIRLRHWTEESGDDLRRLYNRPRRFEALRFLLRSLGTICLLGFLVAVVEGLRGLDAPDPVWWAAGVTCAAVAVTELVNRSLVARHAEDALRRLTWPIRIVFRVFGPILPLLAPIFPRPPLEADEVDEATEEEIEAFLDVGRREGILEAGEEELVRGVVDFGDTQVRSVMTPRVDLVCAPVATPVEGLVDLVLESGHSRIPLYQETVDRIVGILHVRDLLRVVHHEGGSIRPFLQPPHYVPETKSLAQLLRELQERRQEMAVVVDEYGGTAGLVTIEDLLEEIFGELADEHDERELEDVQLPDGSWRLDGRTHVEELEELLGVRVEDESYETVGGLVFGFLGHVPRVGEKVRAHGLEFLVEGADHRRARRVRVTPVGPRVREEG